MNVGMGNKGRAVSFLGIHKLHFRYSAHRSVNPLMICFFMSTYPHADHCWGTLFSKEHLDCLVRYKLKANANKCHLKMSGSLAASERPSRVKRYADC
jgi:hypothetical protein